MHSLYLIHSHFLSGPCRNLSLQSLGVCKLGLSHVNIQISYKRGIRKGKRGKNSKIGDRRV